MIISYSGHHKFEIKPGESVVLGTDNPVVYYDLISGLSSDNEKVIVLDDKYNRKSVNQVINWVGDLMDFNLSKTLDDAVKKIAKNLNEQQINRLHESTNQLLTQVQDALFMTDLPLQVHNDGDLVKIFKYCNISFDHSVINNPHAIIETIISVQNEIGDNNIIGLTNVAHYLTVDQIKELSSFCKNSKKSLVMVEFTSLASQYRYCGSDFYHIDVDFVDWHRD